MHNNSQEYTFFFHLTSPFSNFHPSKFEYKEFTFISNEQFMMFSKAKTFKDEVTAQKIIGLNNHPLAQDFINGTISRNEIIKDKDLSAKWQNIMMNAKKLGRGVQDYDENIWNEKRSKVVLFGARLKFKQNEDLKEIILNTGNTKMVEVSPYDKIWGIGLSEFDAKRIPEAKWPGLNLLGKVLDTLKAELQLENFLDNTQAPTLQKVSYKDIEVMNFYTLNKQIPEDGEYIGRYNRNFNLKASKFANPFPVKSPEERGTTIEKYKEWLWKEIASNNITKEDLLSLRGKKLVCYCAPKPCHGNVVKETVELLVNNESEFDIKVKEIKEKKSKMKP